MSHGEGILITVGIVIVTVAVLDLWRPKAARLGAKGPNGETDLTWNPTTATKAP